MKQPIDEKIRCPHCYESVYKNATVCPHCREHIGWSWLWKPRVSVPVLSSVVSVLMAIITLTQIHEKEIAIQAKNIAQTDASSAIGQKNAIASDANKANLTVANKNISTENLTINDEESFKKSVLLKTTGEVQQALIAAFSLKDQKSIKFVWGGKSPEVGLDSSGFISYILFKINVLDAIGYPEFSSELLKDSFLGVDRKDAKIGDLLIHKSGLCLFYLGDKKGIGIGNANGIRVFDVDLNNDWAVRRWEGMRMLSMTDQNGRRVRDETGRGLFVLQ